MRKLLPITDKNASTLTMSSREIAALCGMSLADLLRSDILSKAINRELEHSNILNVGFILLSKINEQSIKVHQMSFDFLEHSNILRAREYADSLDLLRQISNSATSWFSFDECLKQSYHDCSIALYHLWVELILLSSPKAGDRNTTSPKTYIVFNPKSNLIKIGKSISPKTRIRTLETQAGAIFDVLALIDSDIESKLHKKFAEYRTVGEWFDDRDGAIRKYTKALN